MVIGHRRLRRHKEFETSALECFSDPQEARNGPTLCRGHSTGETGS